MEKVIKCNYCGGEMKCRGCGGEIVRVPNMTCPGNLQIDKPNHLYHQNKECEEKYWVNWKMFNIRVKV